MRLQDLSTTLPAIETNHKTGEPPNGPFPISTRPFSGKIAEVAGLVCEASVWDPTSIELSEPPSGLLAGEHGLGEHLLMDTLLFVSHGLGFTRISLKAAAIHLSQQSRSAARLANGLSAEEAVDHEPNEADDDAEAEQAMRAAVAATVAAGKALIQAKMAGFMEYFNLNKFKDAAVAAAGPPDATLADFVKHKEPSVDVDSFLANTDYQLLWNAARVESTAATSNLTEQLSSSETTGTTSDPAAVATMVTTGTDELIKLEELSPLEQGLRLVAAERLQGAVRAKLTKRARDKATLLANSRRLRRRSSSVDVSSKSKKKVEWVVRNETSVQKGFWSSSGRFDEPGVNAYKQETRTMDMFAPAGQEFGCAYVPTTVKGDTMIKAWEATLSTPPRVVRVAPSKAQDMPTATPTSGDAACHAATPPTSVDTRPVPLAVLTPKARVTRRHSRSAITLLSEKSELKAEPVAADVADVSSSSCVTDFRCSSVFTHLHCTSAASTHRGEKSTSASGHSRWQWDLEPRRWDSFHSTRERESVTCKLTLPGGIRFTEGNALRPSLVSY